MELHDTILIFGGFVSETLGTVSGFGSSTFFVPFASLFESFQFVLAITSLLHCFGNLSRIFIFRRHFEWSEFILLALPSIVLTGAGAILLVYLKPRDLSLPLGCVLMTVAAVFFWHRRTPRTRSPRMAVALSGLSGFLTGFVGTGGAIRGIALSALNLPKSSYIAVSSAVDIGGDFLRAIIYLANGFMDWRQWFYLPLLGVAAYAGAKLGKILVGRLDQKQFEMIVAISIFLSGLTMVLK